MDPNKKENHSSHHHHILPNKMAIGIGGTLLFLTAVTVWIAGVDLGPLNFFVAMVVATIKALLVCLFFMNLLYDRRENGVIFGTSFLFLAIFIVLTATDLFFRGDVYKRPPIATAQASQGKAKFKKPWVSKPEMVAHGKTLYASNCATCHGDAGKGDGPAAAALNPPPRNFTAGEGWKNGRKPSQVFKTLKEGLNAMPSFAGLPAEDRWALAHYVITLGPPSGEDSPDDLAKVGVDPNKDEASNTDEKRTIPVELAMKRMAQPEDPEPQDAAALATESAGGRIYQASCLQCHGATGGGARVQNLGVNPPAYVITRPLKAGDFESFSRIVSRGLPGRLMPGFGSLSGAELRELHSYVKSLPSGR
jgi:caa(3)-type oxidase subunit IV